MLFALAFKQYIFNIIFNQSKIKYKKMTFVLLTSLSQISFTSLIGLIVIFINVEITIFIINVLLLIQLLLLVVAIVVNLITLRVVLIPEYEKDNGNLSNKDKLVLISLISIIILNYLLYMYNYLILI